MSKITHPDDGDFCDIACKANREAPHECDDPKCPGNINRQIIEMFPEIILKLELLASALRDEGKWTNAVGMIDEMVARARALQEAMK